MRSTSRLTASTILLILLNFTLWVSSANARSGSGTRSGSFSKPSTPSRSTPSAPAKSAPPADSAVTSNTPPAQNASSTPTLPAKPATPTPAPIVIPSGSLPNRPLRQFRPDTSPNVTIINGGGSYDSAPVSPGYGTPPGYITPKEIENGTPSTTRSNTSAGWSSFFTVLKWLMILGLIGGGLTLGWIWWHNRPKPVTETEDETVTIAKLQIAVLEQAPQFQSAVQEWMQAAQTDDPVEHAETVKEIALLLLRNQSYWTHAELVETQKLRQDADQVFNYLTMEERSKFSSELFSDRFGIERYAEMFEDDSDSDVSEPGHVWVVTLLLGLEQNKLPIHTVHNASDLKQILSWVGSISPADLSVSEILFMPAAGVALGMEEFVEKYPTLNAL